MTKINFELSESFSELEEEVKRGLHKKTRMKTLRGITEERRGGERLKRVQNPCIISSSNLSNLSVKWRPQNFAQDRNIIKSLMPYTLPTIPMYI